MRDDYKDILVNTGRRPKDRQSRRERNPEHTQEGMKDRYDVDRCEYRMRDRLKPLINALAKNCGRPWNDVYSELCANADHRTIRGFHLRQHLTDEGQGLVQIGEVPGSRHGYTRYHWRPFFVDEKGILRKNPDSYHWRRHNKKNSPDPKTAEAEKVRRKYEEKLKQRIEAEKADKLLEAHNRRLRRQEDAEYFRELMERTRS